MTSQESLKHKCKPGYWLVNVAPLGEDPNWVEQVQPYESPYLCGYEPDEFLAKQYKRNGTKGQINQPACK